MDLVVHPSQTLRDPDPSPFSLRKQTQRPRVIVTEVFLWDDLEEGFGEYDVTILIVVI